MKRSEFQARVKYSWMLRTVDLAWALRRRISSDKFFCAKCRASVRADCCALCRVRWGQGMCRVLILTAMPLSISRDRLEAILEAAGRTSVVAVGDAMLDEYLVGDVE